MIAQLTEQVDNAVKIIDRASSAGDRWMFVAVLLILLAFAGMVIKWLVAHINAKDQRIEEKDKLHDLKLEERERQARQERQEDQAEFLEVINGLKAEIKAQTEQVKQNTEILTKHDREMREAHSIETAVLVRAELMRLGVNPERMSKASAVG